MFGKYNLVAAPVVDTTNRLVGVITIDDVVDVIEEEADEDLQGARRRHAATKNCPTMSGPSRKRRFNWLLVNLGDGVSGVRPCSACSRASSQQMVALAVLAPIVASQGGNAATQTMTVAVRALATRELGSNNAYARGDARRRWSASSTASPLP